MSLPHPLSADFKAIWRCVLGCMCVIILSSFMFLLLFFWSFKITHTFDHWTSPTGDWFSGFPCMCLIKLRYCRASKAQLCSIWYVRAPPVCFYFLLWILHYLAGPEYHFSLHLQTCLCFLLDSSVNKEFVITQALLRAHYKISLSVFILIMGHILLLFFPDLLFLIRCWTLLISEFCF